MAHGRQGLGAPSQAGHAGWLKTSRLMEQRRKWGWVRFHGNPIGGGKS
jgi:hypothetical protein